MNQWENVPTNSNYKEIIKLHDLLDKFNIKHKFNKNFDGWKIKVKAGYAFENQYSRGSSRDLIEVRGFGIKDSKGFLSADHASEYFIVSEWGKIEYENYKSINKNGDYNS